MKNYFSVVLILLCCVIYVHAQNLTLAWKYSTGIDNTLLGHDIKSCFVNNDTIPDLVVTGNSSFWVFYGLSVSPYFDTGESVQVPNATDVVSVECDYFSFPYTDIIVGDPLQNMLFSFRHDGTSVQLITDHDLDLNGDLSGRVEFGSKLLSANLDNDTTPDLVVGDPGSDAVTVFYSNNGAVFSQSISKKYPLAGLSRFGEEFFVADVVGSSYQDLVVSAPLYNGSDTNVGMIVVFPGLGTGTFGSPTSFSEVNNGDRLGSLMASVQRLPGSGKADTVLSKANTQYYFVPPPLSNVSDFFPNDESAIVTAVAFVDNFMNNDSRRELVVASYTANDGYYVNLKVYESGDLPENSLGNSIGWDAGGYIIQKIVDIDNKSPYSTQMFAYTQKFYNGSQGQVIVLRAYSFQDSNNQIGDPTPSATPSVSVPPSTSPNSNNTSNGTSGNDTSDSGSNGSDTTVIVASTVAAGGSCMIIVVAIALWLRRKKKKDDVSSHESDENALEVEDE